MAIYETNISNPKKFRELYSKLALRGDAFLQFNLGESYDDRPPRNRRKAVFWYRKAAEQGLAKAQNALGECLRAGEGCAQSLEEAAQWFEKAARGGNPNAQVSIGVCYFEGAGVAQDWKAALYWYRRAAKGGHSTGMFNIAQMYRRGEGLPKSPRNALRWYRRAADLGNVSAMRWLANAYGGDKDLPLPKRQLDSSRAVAWLKSAAALQDEIAICHLGVHYFNGRGIRRNRRHAAKLYRRAADRGYEWAVYLLGLCYRDGEGVKQNSRYARAWFLKASILGINDARLALQAMLDGKASLPLVPSA